MSHSMSHDDLEFEPIRGLPALLPAGENLLWQGSPDWKRLAVQAYHVRKVAVYFAILLLWRVGLGLLHGDPASAIAVSCLLLMGLGGVAIGVLSLLAYFTARNTVYSITSRRVLLRHGVAVPLTMNVPFKRIDAASLKCSNGGPGDIYLKVSRETRVGYLIGWPHVKPGQYAWPQAGLRALTDATAAAGVLSQALAADAGTEAIPLDARVDARPRDVQPTPPALPPSTAIGLRPLAGTQPRSAAA